MRSFSTEYQALGFLGITIYPVEMISTKTKKTKKNKKNASTDI